MSKTKRAKDDWANWDNDPKRKWTETRDKKRFGKPTKTVKQCYKKRDDSKPKQRLKEAIAHGDDFDEIVLPEAKRHHVWDYN